jgi:hypothetical protein
MLVIKMHYCLPFHKAVIVCLIAVTFGINLLLGFVSLQNSFAQEFDINGDGVVDELDDQSASATTSTDEIQMDINGDGIVDALDEITAKETTTATSSTDEIQMDTNGDGVVDELDTATTETDTTTGIEEATDTPTNNDANSENVVTDEGGVSIADICGDNIDNDADGQMDDSDPEGCMPAYEETATEGDTTTTATGIEEATDTPENIIPTENQVTTGETSQTENCKNFVELDCGAVPTDGETTTETDTTTGIEEATDTPTNNDANSENVATDEGGVSIADICGDNIDNDADGQMDDSDPEGCVINSKIYAFDELTKLIHKISDKLNALKEAVVASGSISSKDIEFANAVNEFSHKFYRQGLDAASHTESMTIPLKITLESFRLWIEDPGNRWGEGSWDSDDLDMSAPCYVTVPASQYKCNAYVAEVIFLATGITFPVIESEEEPGKYFPYQAKHWGDAKKTIPHFVVVNTPQMGDVWSNGGHTGIYLGQHNGVKLYISARDDGDGVYGVDSVQHEHGIQIKQLPEGGVFRTFTP